MNQHIDAIFENGVFRPVVPVNISNGQRVSLNIATKSEHLDDLGDVVDLLDVEYMESCRQKSLSAPSLEEAQLILANFKGSLSDIISAERDER